MEMDLFKDVGRNIQQALKDSGMSQQALADGLGISKQVMSKIITGAKAINVAEISRIASILSTPVDSLLVQSTPGENVEAFSFMGQISCESTRESVEHLKGIINELLFLDTITEGR
ncbi:MAG: helix-turn-helix transcriptional regulator [Deltaproteobacteria bacterium]|nr:helix-turn-helix transcriptional regulator [Deltaproteobacteria bacterium]